MIRAITYYTDQYYISADSLHLSCMKYGVEDFQAYAGLPDYYYKLIGSNAEETQRHHFYLWKPFIIWQHIQTVPDGDILIYADAGQTITNSFFPLIERMDQDIMFFHNPWKHVEWCKMDVAAAINYYEWFDTDLDEIRKKYAEVKQVQASLIIFKVTPEVRNFVKEWLLWCLMPGFCDNSPSKIPNRSTFQEHRYDQAVLTCLQIKYGYKIHEFPSILNMNSPYRLTDHHRKTNSQW